MPAFAKTLSRTKENGVLAPLPVHRFTVDQYHRMIETGVLGEHDRVELLEGWIVSKVTHNPPHDESVWKTQTRLARVLPASWIIRVQSAITTDDSEPEPDIVIARKLRQGYRRFHPRPRHIGTLAEVADTSLEDDRVFQARIYARARIPVYWIINLVDAQVEVYTRPRLVPEPRYQSQQVYRLTDRVPLVLDGRVVARIPVRDLMP